MAIKPKVNTSSLAETVFKQIQMAIVKGEIPHGSKISEPELAKKYGVSRGPLREAIRRLQGRKLVNHTPNAGVRVVSLSSDKLFEIYDIREALEGMACKLAASNMDADEILELKQSVIHNQQQNLQHDFNQDEADLDFHHRIIKGSKNSKLIDMLGIHIFQTIKMYQYQFSSYHKQLTTNLDERILIVEAIERRDPEIAEILMRRHIQNVRKNMEALFNKKDISPIKA